MKHTLKNIDALLNKPDVTVAELQAIDEDGFTPLTFITSLNNGASLAYLERLKDKKVDLNLADQKQRTAIGIATLIGNLLIVESLEAAGAKACDKDIAYAEKKHSSSFINSLKRSKDRLFQPKPPEEKLDPVQSPVKRRATTSDLVGNPESGVVRTLSNGSK